MPAFTNRTDYTTARQALTSAGYQPLTFPRQACIGSPEICEAYPEIVDCSGTGLNPCRFAFRAPDGGFIVGVAQGESLDHMTLTGIAVANAEDSQVVRNLLAGRPALADD
ncbi:MAG: hypothetical protein M0D54_02365 [Hyphomonadaceae bacterium JAD_PAG50586_4]|nr:MAG: hypothetical protein M0D54_02365 [Hyphomonadaceae bacterium JAD_PAG50586_4]